MPCAGIDGVSLTDKGDTVDVTLKELKAGDKISIAGKNYSIGAESTDGQKLVTGQENDGQTITVNGTTYTYDATNKWTDGNGNKVKIGTGAQDGEIKIGAGDVVSNGTKTLTVMKDANVADGIDDNDSTVITAGKAYQLQTAEIVKASSIGTDTAAEVKGTNKNDNYATATTTFTLTKGAVSYKDALSFNLHVGADADMTNKITVNIDSMNSAGLGVKGIKADTEQDATYAIDAIADAISTVSSQRSSLGAVQDRLEHTINNLDNVVENTTSAESRIRDTDMAEEMVNYSKNNILAQAGQSMLAQANQSNQGVLSLLQ